MVYSTLIIDYLRSNIPLHGIFDLGNKKIVKVEYTGIWYIIDLGIEKLFEVANIATGTWNIRP